jgi:hypothetical protein
MAKPRSPLFDKATPAAPIDAAAALSALGGLMVVRGNLGAQRFLVAANAVRLHNLHGNTARRNRLLDIWVSPSDLYEVELINGATAEVIAAASDVFGEDLHETVFRLVYGPDGFAR